MTNTIIDLESYTCSSDPIEAIEHLRGKNNIVFKISNKNPYFSIIINKYEIDIIKQEGDIIYFMIRLNG
ncbi:hypothetical protein [Saccharolobus caldissimus]|uniref:Uncharacterized protein n=1 Tax=Saccharolobus caldissimus TaxID=1702097 RepID=A0AAQ4CST8_9CREN|nr:hypothetical protein [Saccharolobus caldissimus]BDB98869.1 hypothetical protein SACC_18860 [Saccharolobus caldissimus]